MRIVKTPGILPIIQSRAYKVRLHNLVVQYANTDQMKEILKDFTLDDIDNAISQIYISDGFICTPEYNQASFILRLLQYGGYKIKAMNLLTQAIKDRRFLYDK